ncbi:MGH1-like glycoside hydrolase domain-containing protein [Pontimicrobium sp. MEBiC06410]
MIKNTYILLIITVCLFASCNGKKNIDNNKTSFKYLETQNNLLNYKITPKHKFDKNGLMFSDQGAWFAYSFPDSTNITGFTGPFLMTQQNGIWSSSALTNLVIDNTKWISHKIKSYNSHLEQTYHSKKIELQQQLVFISGHTAAIKTIITNKSKSIIDLKYSFRNNKLLADSLKLSKHKNELITKSSKTEAIGHVVFPEEINISVTGSGYISNKVTETLKPNTSKEFTVYQSFIFPEYSWQKEQKTSLTLDFDTLLLERRIEKNNQLKTLIQNRKKQFQNNEYAQVLSKAHVTLQNNWRIPTGEIKYEGLFPSYHYTWFNGFWSWDSWKHSVGLSYYNTDLAKQQIKLMFEFQNKDGFVVDCVYRDTTIEAHNYRNTKPPLSAWAVAKIYEKDKDIAFVQNIYPKLINYHNWWYNKRDHDQDGLCEYGSTDGSLIAAKWESGMDNAIRFDNSKILKNSEEAYSLDQESVDLNAYLYAEKLYLAQLATELKKEEEAKRLINEASILKTKIQKQFYDKKDGWFYDTNLQGTQFIKGEGSEGWTVLWAKAATKEQAAKVRIKMMDTTKFYTKVPFQTMSADHAKFDPLKGYWRGPNWLDQAYFGVKALRNYGYNEDADKATVQILKGAEGLLEKGTAIRENYHPLTGKGLHAHNFSWSAAHIIMLLMNENNG